jgi:uncharacterized membrane protein
MNTPAAIPLPSATDKPLRIALWAAQTIAAVIFIAAGLTKLTAPIPELAGMIPWTGDFSPSFVRFIGLVDLAGGLGLLLPALTRIAPRLTVWAAAGCIALQILAFGFHFMRGEADMLPINLILVAIAGFIFWGRNTRLPITPRA